MPDQITIPESRFLALSVHEAKVERLLALHEQLTKEIFRCSLNAPGTIFISANEIQDRLYEVTSGCLLDEDFKKWSAWRIIRESE